MLRQVIALALAASSFTLSIEAQAGDAYTTRIEPQAFYGATVTIEHGVRVFRPLPTTRHVVVNPGGLTPLHLGYEDVRVSQESRNYNYNYNTYAPRTGARAIGGFIPGFGLHRGHGHHKGGHGGMITGTP